MRAWSTKSRGSKSNLMWFRRRLKNRTRNHKLFHTIISIGRKWLLESLVIPQVSGKWSHSPRTKINTRLRSSSTKTCRGCSNSIRPSTKLQMWAPWHLIIWRRFPILSLLGTIWSWPKILIFPWKSRIFQKFFGKKVPELAIKLILRCFKTFWKKFFMWKRVRMKSSWGEKR